MWLARGVDAAPFARLERLAEAASTNTVLREAATADPSGWPHLSAVLAAHQTAGRGRAGRRWQTPPGAALTASVLVRPRVPAERLPWLTLLAGLAVVRGLPGAVGLKWPNDVLVADAGTELAGWGTARKVGGILTELLPGRPPAAVVGIGVNLTQGPEDLPVPSATSLALAGLPAPTAPELLTAVGRELAGLLARWEAHDGDAQAAGLLADVADRCLTLGRPVRVDLPGAAPLHGTARAIDDAGRLLVRDAAGREHAVLAGDVLHVRGEDMDSDDSPPPKR
ncbi:biotin--[acetyl-CoA-carboxylase] ligase [Georgenia sp. 311]|nr:biotin--[acetyl-CoA-carboxylase] ligase [Georgenia sp. 311]